MSATAKDHKASIPLDNKGLFRHPCAGLLNAVDSWKERTLSIALDDLASKRIHLLLEFLRNRFGKEKANLWVSLNDPPDSTCMFKMLAGKKEAVDLVQRYGEDLEIMKKLWPILSCVEKESHSVKIARKSPSHVEFRMKGLTIKDEC
jgi:hypothetical protein